jgi:HlyD family secretion protein
VQVQLGALISARVAATPVEAGARVHQGALLLQLQDAAQAAALQQAQVSLTQARLQLDEVERQYRRMQALSAKGIVSASQFDAESSRRDLARNQLDGSRAALAQAQAQLAETTITAPADGVLLRRDVEVGDLVQPGVAVLSLAVGGPVEVRVDADERYLAALAVGQPATVIADAYPDRPFGAVVSEIAPVVDRQAGTVELKLAVAEPPDFLLNDMTASAEIVVGESLRALLLPITAIRVADPDAWVWRVVDGTALRQPVTLGLKGRDQVEILSGLVPGEPVVADAADVEEGERVRPVPGGAR